MMPYPSYCGFGRVDGYLPGMGMVEPDGGDSSLTRISTAEAKAIAASKSHSEAERRRRQRINGHLATLRTLLPNAAKTDKASLLAEVVQRVKELRRHAADVVSFDITGGKTDVHMSENGDIEGEKGKSTNNSINLPLLPDETDDVTTEAEPGSSLIRATVSCEDRPELLSDLDAALKSLKVKAVRAEIATLGGRTKGVFSIRAEEADCATIRRALRAVLEKGCAFPGSKRPRLARPFGGSGLFQ
ncbi:transcription factor bHLH30-like [Aristolochia californica]|uniref:transcription factor bHLH30-like n=1 Tax=Aristolochia californica TaxID=171875 RepID=UPI0035DA8272